MANTSMVITIGRQYESGGRELGKLLAERLGIPYYDKELLAEAAKDSGICQEIFEDHDEKPTRSLLFSLVTGAQYHNGDTGTMYMDMPLNHRIFLAQFDAIRRIASQGPCVIVGRCADYVLRDRPNVLNVFVKADLESRIERAIAQGVEHSRAEDVVRKADKQRASYYNYYATGTWGDVNNYDLCVDTARLGIAGAVDLVEQCVRTREKLLKEGK